MATRATDPPHKLYCSPDALFPPHPYIPSESSPVDMLHLPHPPHRQPSAPLTPPLTPASSAQNSANSPVASIPADSDAAVHAWLSSPPNHDRPLGQADPSTIPDSCSSDAQVVVTVSFGQSDRNTSTTANSDYQLSAPTAATGSINPQISNQLSLSDRGGGRGLGLGGILLSNNQLDKLKSSSSPYTAPSNSSALTTSATASSANSALSMTVQQLLSSYGTLKSFGPVTSEQIIYHQPNQQVFVAEFFDSRQARNAVESLENSSQPSLAGAHIRVQLKSSSIEYPRRNLRPTGPYQATEATTSLAPSPMSTPASIVARKSSSETHSEPISSSTTPTSATPLSALTAVASNIASSVPFPPYQPRLDFGPRSGSLSASTSPHGIHQRLFSEPSSPIETSSIYNFQSPGSGEHVLRTEPLSVQGKKEQESQTLDHRNQMPSLGQIVDHTSSFQSHNRFKSTISSCSATSSSLTSISGISSATGLSTIASVSSSDVHCTEDPSQGDGFEDSIGSGGSAALGNRRISTGSLSRGAALPPSLHQRASDQDLRRKAAHQSPALSATSDSAPQSGEDVGISTDTNPTKMHGRVIPGNFASSSIGLTNMQNSIEDATSAGAKRRLNSLVSKTGPFIRQRAISESSASPPPIFKDATQPTADRESRSSPSRPNVELLLANHNDAAAQVQEQHLAGDHVPNAALYPPPNPASAEQVSYPPHLDRASAPPQPTAETSYLPMEAHSLSPVPMLPHAYSVSHDHLQAPQSLYWNTPDISHLMSMSVPIMTAPPYSPAPRAPYMTQMNIGVAHGTPTHYYNPYGYAPHQHQAQHGIAGLYHVDNRGAYHDVHNLPPTSSHGGNHIPPGQPGGHSQLQLQVPGVHTHDVHGHLPASARSAVDVVRDPPPEHNQIGLDRIADGLDTRTTVMIKNIPNKLSDKDLAEFIHRVCPRKIDFLYLRMDFQNGCNVGYAFVNFIHVEDLLHFARTKLGVKWNMFSSEKVLQMSYANYQGKEALVEKFKNSCVMDERESWRPKIFYSSGPRQGLPEPFPAPTHLRRKERSSQNRGALYVPGSQSALPGGAGFPRTEPNYHGGFSPSMRRSYQHSGSHSRQRTEDRL